VGEIVRISINVKRKHRQLIEDGYSPGGPPPAGFRVERHTIGQKRNDEPRTVSKWVPDSDTWGLAREAWRMRVIEGATLKEIHRATSLLGTTGSYRTFFKNRIYIGELEWGGEVYPDFVEPLIP
jgi:hypothetical protein